MKKMFSLLLLLALLLCTGCRDESEQSTRKVPADTAADLMEIYRRWNGGSPILPDDWAPSSVDAFKSYRITARGGYASVCDLNGDGKDELLFGKKNTGTEDPLSPMLITSIFTIRGGKPISHFQSVAYDPYKERGATGFFKNGTLLIAEVDPGEPGWQTEDQRYSSSHSFYRMEHGELRRKLTVNPFLKDGEMIYGVFEWKPAGGLKKDYALSRAEYDALYAKWTGGTPLQQPEWHEIQREAPAQGTTARSAEEIAAQKAQQAEEDRKSRIELYENAAAGVYPAVESTDGKAQDGYYAALYDFDGDGVKDLISGYGEGSKGILVSGISLLRDGEPQPSPRFHPIDPDEFVEQTVFYANGVFAVTSYAMGDPALARENYYRVVDGKFCKIAGISLDAAEMTWIHYTEMLAPYDPDHDPYTYPFGSYHDENAVSRTLTAEEYRTVKAELTGGGDPVELPWLLVEAK